jgi:hypothetical protein
MRRTRILASTVRRRVVDKRLNLVITGIAPTAAAMIWCVDSDAKIQKIKRLREVLGYSLSEAMQAVKKLPGLIVAQSMPMPKWSLDASSVAHSVLLSPAGTVRCEDMRTLSEISDELVARGFETSIVLQSATPAPPEPQTLLLEGFSGADPESAASCISALLRIPVSQTPALLYALQHDPCAEIQLMLAHAKLRISLPLRVACASTIDALAAVDVLGTLADVSSSIMLPSLEEVAVPPPASAYTLVKLQALLQARGFKTSLVPTKAPMPPPIQQKSIVLPPVRLSVGGSFAFKNLPVSVKALLALGFNLNEVVAVRKQVAYEDQHPLLAASSSPQAPVSYLLPSDDAGKGRVVASVSLEQMATACSAVGFETNLEGGGIEVKQSFSALMQALANLRKVLPDPLLDHMTMELGLLAAEKKIDLS